MKSSVIVFPGSNCDRDVEVALTESTGHKPIRVWHQASSLPPSDLIVLPGGFSHGDYLRGGAIAARSRVMHEVFEAVKRGVRVLGICNGFQILTEMGLLPGTLLANVGLRFICRPVHLRAEGESFVTKAFDRDEVVQMPVAHGEGNYQADPATLECLEGEGRVAFRYCAADGAPDPAANPNGSANAIAGITDKSHRIFGLMPHPERTIKVPHYNTIGHRFFRSLMPTPGLPFTDWGRSVETSPRRKNRRPSTRLHVPARPIERIAPQQSFPLKTGLVSLQ